MSQEMLHYSEVDLEKENRARFPTGSGATRAAIHAGDTWKVHVALKKTGERLLFDFTGSSPQAKKGINLPYHATFGACYEAILSTMAYDLPKNHGALRPIEVIAPAGHGGQLAQRRRRFRSTPPPPGRRRSSSPTRSSSRCSPPAKNGAANSWRSTSAIAWHATPASINMAIIMSRRFPKAPSTAPARAPTKTAMIPADGLSSHNIEWLEANFPLLYLFRRNTRGGGGAGKFRGGAGSESALTVHDAPQGKIKGVALGVAGLRNSGQGLFGGYPGAPSLLTLIQGARVEETIAADQVTGPTRCARRRVADCCHTVNLISAAMIFFTCAWRVGAATGIRSNANRRRFCAMSMRRSYRGRKRESIYGVEIEGDNPTLNPPATEMRRAALRKQRLKENDMSHPLRENLEVVSESGADSIRCSKCQHLYCRADEDWRVFSTVRLSAPTHAGRLFADLERQLFLPPAFLPVVRRAVETDFIEAPEAK